MSNLHQISMIFEPEQDRILLRLKTSDFSEIRLWLTRRYVKLLWPLVGKLLNDGLTEITVGAQNPETRDALLAFRHQEAVSKANYSEQYSDKVMSTPLGEAPVLVTRLGVNRAENGNNVVSMRPAEGQGVDLAMDESLLHSFTKLLHETVGKTDWDLQLELPGAAGMVGASDNVVLN